MSASTPPFDVVCGPGSSPGERRIQVSGEFDSGGCQQLAEVFAAQLDLPGTERVVLDLRELEFIDSAGTQTLIELERRARDAGIAVEVLPPPESVTALLQLAGVTQRMNLVASEGSAVPEEFLERIDLELEREPTAPAQARAEVRQALSGTLDDAGLAIVVLLTSEITTNGVIHPREVSDRRLGLRVTVYPGRIRVQVDDPGDGFDPSVPVQPDDDGGRGLLLVDRASARWGTSQVATARGTRFAVWFDFEPSQAKAQAVGG